ncbi:MAG: Holliday junction resolvase RuvX [Syntrophomonas sp.]
MRIMGLDVGEKRIGVAISDPMGWTAQGHSVLKRRTKSEDLEYLEQVCREFEVETIVIGFPRNMNGSIGPKALEIEAFATELKEYAGLPMELWDERLTTRSAEKVLLEANLSRSKRKQVIDKVAAVHILQSYLDSRRYRSLT